MRRGRSAIALAVITALIAGIFIWLGPTTFAKQRSPVRPAIACFPGSLSPTCAQWTVMASPNPSTTFNTLSSVAALSPTDVWAVGHRDGDIYGGCSACKTLTEHWNGSAWSVIPSLTPGNGGALSGVAALSTSDVWTVGNEVSLGNGYPLIEHWNGTSWSVSAAADAGSTQSHLSGVAADAPNDVWAVGTTATNLDQPLVEHWNGSAWSTIPVPGVSGAESNLTAVAAISATDVWAVGYSYPGSAYLALTEHWDGTNWSIIPSPSPYPDTGRTYLRGVTAVASNNVWAVGSYFVPSQNTDQTLIEHWDGMKWTIVASPDVNQSSLSLYPNDLSGVIALSADNIWAVGSGHFLTLTVHWDGVSWRVVPSANVGQYNVGLAGIAGLVGKQVWAVGGYAVGTSGTASNTLVETRLASLPSIAPK